MLRSELYGGQQWNEYISKFKLAHFYINLLGDFLRQNTCICRPLHSTHSPLLGKPSLKSRNASGPRRLATWPGTGHFRIHHSQVRLETVPAHGIHSCSQLQLEYLWSPVHHQVRAVC